MTNEPIISVCIVTYNQEKYIGECIQSVVNQITDIPFEIIIGDDASTDNTLEIARSFSKEHPEFIYIIEHPINIGPTANIRSVYRKARGKFIAHLDGDDLMHPSKLKTQYEILVKNTDCVACTHEVFLIDPNGIKLKSHWKNAPEGRNHLPSLLNDMPFFAHSSKFFKRTSLNLSLLNQEIIDCTIHYDQIKQGPFYHTREPLGSYRLMTGITSNKTEVNRTIIQNVQKIYEDAIKNSQDHEKTKAKQAYAKSLMEFAYQSAVLNNKDDFKYFIKKSYSLKIISATQIAMRALRAFPAVACFIAKTRSQFRPGGLAFKCLH